MNPQYPTMGSRRDICLRVNSLHRPQILYLTVVRRRYGRSNICLFWRSTRQQQWEAPSGTRAQCTHIQTRALSASSSSSSCSCPPRGRARPPVWPQPRRCRPRRQRARAAARRTPRLLPRPRWRRPRWRRPGVAGGWGGCRAPPAPSSVRAPARTRKGQGWVGAGCSAGAGREKGRRGAAQAGRCRSAAGQLRSGLQGGCRAATGRLEGGCACARPIESAWS